MPRRSQPARRVFHDRDDTRTAPDERLPIAFEDTSPEITILAFEDAPTTPGWVLPAVGLVLGLVIGAVVFRRGRAASAGASSIAGEDSGLDLLGAE